MSRFSFLILTAAVACVCGQPTPRYSSKTGYETSFEPGTTEKAQRSRSWQTIASDVGESAAVAGCQPVGVYTVNRHGVRYMSDGDIEDYNTILARMKTTGISDQFAALLNITDNLYPISREGQLHPAGFAEMEGLGARIKARMAELIGGSTGLVGFDFQGTYRQRTIDSAQGFITGLLGPGANCSITDKTATKDTLTCSYTNDTETVFVDHAEEGDDLLLKFYESCTNYITSVDDNDTAVIEATKFGDGPELTSVYDAVAMKLAPTGSSGPWNMTKDELEVMHHMCGYETAYYGSSPWCDLFTNDESLVVEYWLDLDQYWAEGYGHPINYEIACPLVDDIATYMRSAKESGNIKGSFKFGHSSTFQPLLAILGLYRDTPMLYADNYATSVNRTWRSGRISSMSANMGFNVFQCPSDEYRVLVLHNELPIKLGSCEEFFCPFDQVESHLEASSNGCRWDDLCGTDNVYPGTGAATSLHVPQIMLILSTLLVLLFAIPS